MVEEAPFEEQTFGRYRLLSRLGEGGMAEVFKAKSFGVEGFEKIIVIKRILPRLAHYKAFIDMFIREAKVTVRLSHANIVQVFDLGKVDSHNGGGLPSYYMAMEYVAGIDLATLLEKSRSTGLKLPSGLAIYVTSEIAKGLDHAHRRCDEHNQPLGIVHRDVSPQNVLLSWEGEVKVTDFGIAKARDSLEGNTDSQVRTIKGKYSYMSPEQARGDDLDRRSDLFSLGTLLYEILAGVNPFRAAEPTETLRRIRDAEFPPLALIIPDLPTPLTELVTLAMAPAPDQRFEDAARMYEALLTYSYQAGARFGASDLSAFLQQIRDLPSLRSTSKRQEITPVHVRTLVPRLTSEAPEPPTEELEEEESEVVQLREVTLLYMTIRQQGGDLGTFSGLLLERIAAICEYWGGRILKDLNPSHLQVLFGLEEADYRDTERCTQAALSALRTSTDTYAQLSASAQIGRVRVHSSGAPIPEDIAELAEQTRRLPSHSPGRLILSRDTAKQVRGLFLLEEQGGVFIVKDHRPVQEVYGKFLGRREELASLGTILGHASRRQLQMISLVGSAGMGKTRLLHEMDRRLRRGNFNVGVYIAPCSPRGQKIPFSGVATMLQVLCGVQEGDSPEKIRLIAPSLRALGLLDDEIDTVLSHLGVTDLHPEGSQTLRSAFIKTLLRLAEDRVHVFAWDNAQWLDEASSKLLDTSLRRLTSARIALAFASREDLGPLLQSAQTKHTFVLEDLPQAEAVQLISARLGVNEVPAALIDFCTRRAGGHPLFLEEILRDLIDSGTIIVQDSIATIVNLERETPVPRPLRAVMTSRVERLSPHEQELLQAAAVLGETFEGPIVEAMIGSADGLQSLEHHEVIHGSSSSSFTFISPLLRDVVLEAIPTETRQQLHAKAAASLIQTGGTSERIAEHLQEAGKQQEAGELLARSCERHTSSGQHEVAVVEGLQALTLLDPTETPLHDWIKLLGALAGALDRIRVAPNAPALLLQTLDNITSRATIHEEVAIRIEVSRALGALSCFDAAQKVLNQAPMDGLPAEQLQKILLAQAEIYFRQGDFRRCREIVVSIDLTGITSDQLQRTMLLQGQTYAISTERDRVLALIEQIPLEEGPIYAAQIEKLRALAHFFARDFTESAAASERGANLARQGGLPFEVALHLHNLGDVLLHLGDYPRAYAALQQSLSLCEQHHEERLAQQNRMYLGYLDARRGLPGGETLLRDAIEQAQYKGYIWDEINGKYLLGRLLEDMGLLRAAAIEFESCRILASSNQNALIEEECTHALSRIAQATRGSLARKQAVSLCSCTVV